MNRISEMAAQFALSWIRPDWVAQRMGKLPGRTVSRYRTSVYEDVEVVARHINSMNPDMMCTVEVFTS